jgi:hypothetical protein
MGFENREHFEYKWYLWVYKLGNIKGNVTKFNLCFTIYWVNFNKFIMVKMANPLMNKEQWLWTNEFINS